MSIDPDGITMASSSSPITYIDQMTAAVGSTVVGTPVETTIIHRKNVNPYAVNNFSQDEHHSDDVSQNVINAKKNITEHVSQDETANNSIHQNVIRTGMHVFHDNLALDDDKTSINGQPSVTYPRRHWIFKKYKHYARYMNSRARPGHAYEPTTEEHVANMFTHGLFVLPSIFAMFWMLSLATNSLQRNIATIYGIALFILFGVSTTFHALSYSGKFTGLKNFFHIGDRAVIYIFIAASYTPWLTLKDYNGWGFSVLCVVWTMAVCGIYYQYTFHEQYKWLETLFYLIIGVCPSIVCLAMKEKSGMFELAFGGSVYISGVVFFKCDGLIPFAHAIWHCFVTIGAVCHYQAVCWYLLGDHNDYSEEMIR